MSEFPSQLCVWTGHVSTGQEHGSRYLAGLLVALEMFSAWSETRV